MADYWAIYASVRKIATNVVEGCGPDGCYQAALALIRGGAMHAVCPPPRAIDGEAGGWAGAAKAIEILAGEMERTFGYISVRRVSEIGPHIFAPRNLSM
mgnify:CR=1 FL=1